MGMRAPVTLNVFRGPSEVDWKDLKRKIIAALGPDRIYRAFAELGVRFDGPYNSKGKAQCHAMDRDDVNPSAFVNVMTGIYHSKGDSVETINLFDFALKHGSAKFGDWLGTVKHFAEQAGIPIDARKDGKGRILEATYDYQDKEGKLLYQVLRYRMASGKKDFRQRRPDGADGWIYDLEGVGRVLYGMPAITESPGFQIVIVEGEKDADRLNELFHEQQISIIATTSAQGANDTGRWQTYAELLAGRDCILIPDNDAPGLRHARGVADFLHGIAKTIKMVALPGVGPKGDVSDWLDQDNSVDDLWALIVDAPTWDPATAPAEDVDLDAGRDATAADLVKANAGTRWLWPNWIPLGVLTLLTAEPSTGKTRLGLDLTRRIALGLEWPDGQPMDLGDRRPVVLWIPADNQHSELSDAPTAFGFPAETIILNTTVGNLYGGTELQQADQLDDLEARIIRQQPAMVIIDTITNTSELKSQDSSDAKRQYKPLQDIAKRTGTAIVCVTHTNVAGKTLGRRADEKTRVTLRLECPDPEGQSTRRKLSVALTRLSIVPPALGVTMGDGGSTYDATPPEAPVQKDVKQSGLKVPAPAVQRAIGFLLTRLKHGEARVTVVRKEGENQDPPIVAARLYDARDHLGIEEFERQGIGTAQVYKWWKLPPDLSTDEEVVQDVPY